MSQLASKDYLVFLIYFIVVAVMDIGFINAKKSTTDSKDFFLAEGALTWWAIGASLIASNISAEHFIGMSVAPVLHWDSLFQLMNGWQQQHLLSLLFFLFLFI